MTDSGKQSKSDGRFVYSTRHLIVLGLLVAPILYLLTMAQTIVFGDPTEYTFVANVLGIAHPPGYAFITLTGKLFQTLIPLGEIPWRMHLLSVSAATLAVFFLYGMVRTIGRTVNVPYSRIVAVFSALVVALASDFWQHAIHTNPHIITATFLSANLFFLTRWWASLHRTAEVNEDATVSSDVKSTVLSAGGDDKWLYAFCFSAGLGIAHHPLTVFAFPAYLLLIIWLKLRIWREWRTLIKMIAFWLLGLSLLLYYPIRSPMQPVFGPDDMNSLAGFLDHVLARGLTESLPFFGLADQPDRALVFWTLLRLQYSLPVISLALFGGFWLVWDKARLPVDQPPGSETSNNWPAIPSLRPLALLYGVALVSNYLFVINLRQQDIMAYLLGVFFLVGLLAGIGLLGLVDLVQRRSPSGLDWRAAALVLFALFLLGPILQTVRNLPSISLRDFSEGSNYVEAVFAWFRGQDEGAILLNDWEHMTPLWYARFVEDRWPDPADVQPQLVSTDMPWLQSVFFYLPSQPVYLSGYRPEIVAAGLRLRPRGSFYQVLQPGDTSFPPELTRIDPEPAGELEILGYDLPQREVRAGDYIPLSLAMRTNGGTNSFYVPVLIVEQGETRVTYEYTTDGHLTTPQWEPGEIIVERFDVALPHDLPGGAFTLALGVRNLNTGEDTELALPLGELTILPQSHPPAANRHLANFRQQVGLVSAIARNGLLERTAAPWKEPIQLSAGDTLHLTLEWESFAPADESYTVFVHLIDLANRPVVTLDYTPLGGSTPTHLWIPKWLPGQRMRDPYRLEIPSDLSPGQYLVEVGLYEMTGGRRLHLSDAAGNLAGDRFILGAVEVLP